MNTSHFELKAKLYLSPLQTAFQNPHQLQLVRLAGSELNDLIRRPQKY